MRAIYWKTDGASVEIVKAVNAGEAFAVVVEGVLAKSLVGTLGSGDALITPGVAKLLIVTVVCIAILGIMLYALAKGYKISGKVHRLNT